MGKAHQNITDAENHQIHNNEFADRDAREAGTFSSPDIGKVYYQTDEDSYWVLLSTSPEFARVSGPYGEETNTTDDTTTVIWSFTLPDNCALSVTAKITAMQSDGSDRNFYWVGGLFYRDGGSATQQGATFNVITAIESDAGPSVDFNVSSNDVRLRWTGVAAENWVVTPEVEYSLTVN